MNKQIEPEVAASTYFVLGNLQVKLADQMREADPFSAISALEEGVESFERSIKLISNNDVAINLEIARKLLKELKEENPPKTDDTKDQSASQKNNKEQESTQQQSEKEQNNSSTKNQEGKEDPLQENDNSESDSDKEEGKLAEETAMDILKEESDKAAQRSQRIIKVSPVTQDW